jgi:hypothetical protein
MNTDMEVHTGMNVMSQGKCLRMQVGTRQKVRGVLLQAMVTLFPLLAPPLSPARLMVFLSLSLCVHESN